jgi:hypothetical protein
LELPVGDRDYTIKFSQVTFLTPKGESKPVQPGEMLQLQKDFAPGLTGQGWAHSQVAGTTIWTHPDLPGETLEIHGDGTWDHYDKRGKAKQYGSAVTPRSCS